MTVINQESKHEVNERNYEVDEPESCFYTEKATNLLYEVKLFPDFVLVRPIIPEAQITVSRIDINTFCELFDEFLGDTKELRQIMFGAIPSNILISKKKNKNDGDE